MNWYVKCEKTGKIDGPMTKEEALLGPKEGMAFSEKVFEPEFVTSEETETLLTEMRSRVNEKQQGLTSVDTKELLNKAADTIVLLSREKVIYGSIEGGVLTVDEMPEGVKLEVNDYDIEGCNENSLTKDESGETCAKLEFSKG